MIAVGAPKHDKGMGLGAPLPVEKAGKGGMPPTDESDSGDTEESPAHEATETPEEEQGEDYGAKLVADIDAVAKRYGADQQTGRELFADMLTAVAKCLKGEDSGDQQAEGGNEGYGQQ